MKKKIITTAIIVVVLVLLGALYLWYNGNYAGKKKIKLTATSQIDYEWQKMASDNGIVRDYLWQRTREYLVNECGSNGLIPSSYMIPGRLTTQPGESSEVYSLEDQALLLKMYVKSGERLAASSLKRTVEEQIDISAQDNMGRVAWLDACLLYYDSYGTKKDYTDIQNQISMLFDENGMLKPETLFAAIYQEGAFASVNDNGDVRPEDVNGSLTGIYDDISANVFAFEGVRISSINLLLIRDLESNNLLPEGSFTRNLEVVNNALVSSTIHLYAFAYSEGEEGTHYIFSHNVAASIDVSESIRTMLNLARVGELPEVCFTWLKNTIVNNGILMNTYYFISGSVDGSEAIDTYTDILEIAYLYDDRDLFGRICSIEGNRVATYTNSPALSLIYREENGRYVLYARENLGVCLMIF